jgi:hypothetical protein
MVYFKPLRNRAHKKSDKAHPLSHPLLSPTQHNSAPFPDFFSSTIRYSGPAAKPDYIAPVVSLEYQVKLCKFATFGNDTNLSNNI